jgi:hypothetical protein
MTAERPTSNLSLGNSNLKNEAGNLLSAANGAVTRAITGPAWLPCGETIAVGHQPGVARSARSAYCAATRDGRGPAAGPRQATCYNHRWDRPERADRPQGLRKPPEDFMTAFAAPARLCRLDPKLIERWERDEAARTTVSFGVAAADQGGVKVRLAAAWPSPAARIT